MRRSVLTAILAAASVAFSVQALAHAHLTQATPAPETIVQSPPTTLELRFSEEVEAEFATIEIKGPAGGDVPIKTIVGAPGDKKILMVTPATPLTIGTYRVFWRAVSIDTHTSEGNYSFTVQP